MYRRKMCHLTRVIFLKMWNIIKHDRDVPFGLNRVFCSIFSALLDTSSLSVKAKFSVDGKELRTGDL